MMKRRKWLIQRLKTMIPSSLMSRNLTRGFLVVAFWPEALFVLSLVFSLFFFVF